MTTPPQPSTKLWDYSAYAAIPQDNLRHEIIGGQHFVNSTPNLYHQQVSRRIQFQLYSAIELNDLGVVFYAPVDLQLSKHDIVQPDLVIVLRERRHILTPAKIKGVPDLVVEILSPSNERYDLEIKRELYERCGVPEYWIVAPDDHEVTQLILVEGRYQSRTCSEQVTMSMPPSTTVDLTKVWQGSFSRCSIGLAKHFDFRAAKHANDGPACVANDGDGEQNGCYRLP